MTITFQKESFTALLPELPELFILHDSEISEDETTPIDPDWRRYIALEVSGALHVMTVRDGQKLVGYYIAMVMPHLHRKHQLCAYSDLFFIKMAYRNGWAGYKLFVNAEKMLKELGVHKSYLVTKAQYPITIIVKRLKYALVELVHTKIL
jgi:hypothetical protein